MQPEEHHQECARTSFADDPEDTAGRMTLLEAERTVKQYTLRLWFAFQYADAATIALLEQRRDAANTAIEGFLRARAKQHRKRCRVCERMLPRFSSYSLCQRCYASGRRA